MTQLIERIAPLRLLGNQSEDGIGTGGMRAVVARAGVGKTSCLVAIALGRMLLGKKVIHVSLGETPEKIAAHYALVIGQLMEHCEDRDLQRERLEKNRIILSFLRQSFDKERFRANLENLKERLHFTGDTVILDGFNFENAERPVVESLGRTASEFGAELWFSIRSHRHISDRNERGALFPLSRMDDLFDTILEIEQEGDHMILVLKRRAGKACYGEELRCNQYFLTGFQPA